MTHELTMELEHGTAYDTLAELAGANMCVRPRLEMSPTEVDRFIERMHELIAESAAFPDGWKGRS